MSQTNAPDRGPPGPAWEQGLNRFHDSLKDFLRDLPRSAQRFWVLVVAVGILVGVGAALLLELLSLLQHLAWGAGGEDFLAGVEATPPLRRFLLLVFAGALVSLVSLLVGQPLKGHGTAGIIESIWAKSGRMALPRALLRGLVSIVVVAFGAPLGREGALLSTGGASASALAYRFRTTPEQARLLVACGASAGMAAAYNVPIGAALFGLEVLLGSFALELFGPIVVACVTATLVTRVLVGDQPTYLIPEYALNTPREMLLCLPFGILLGLASALYVRGINLPSTLVERAPDWLAPYLPVVAMGAVGLAAWPLPQLLGNGYDVVNQALQGEVPLHLLVLLPFAKLLASSLCAGAGVPGGLFTPSLFYGALLGGALGWVAGELIPGAAPSGAYALLGMGAVLAGTTHAPVSAVLIIFELTGDYRIILPLMLSCVVAAAVARRLEPESLYTAVLRRRQVDIPMFATPEWMRAQGVRAYMDPDAPRVPPTAPFEEVVAELLDAPPGFDVYVTDSSGRLLGVIPLDSLKGHLPDYRRLKHMLARDVMRRDVRPLRDDISLAEAATRFGRTSLERLPVVDAQRHFLGTVSKGSLLRQGRF